MKYHFKQKQTIQFLSKIKFPILFFANGFLFAMVFYFHSEHKYDADIFKAIKSYVQKEKSTRINITDDSILVLCNSLVHDLETSRQYIFGSYKFDNFKTAAIAPVSFDLMTGSGACGSNAMVLGRLLKEFDYRVRIGQMKVDGVYGGHIVLEVQNKTTNKWQVFDPLFNLYFRNKDGSIASFEEVGKNWNYMKTQTPNNYDLKYAYEGVRYTNWEKVPIVLPLLKKVLTFFAGKSYTETFSMRTFFLQKHKFFRNVFLMLFGISIFFTIWFQRRANTVKVVKAN
jgi:hypothetical protein